MGGSPHPFFFNLQTMVNLEKNTADQSMYLSLNERVKDFGTQDSYEITWVNAQTREVTTQDAVVAGENERITELTVSTVGLNHGQYEYLIHGVTEAGRTLFERGIVNIKQAAEITTTEPTQEVTVNYENYGA